MPAPGSKRTGCLEAFHHAVANQRHGRAAPRSGTGHAALSAEGNRRARLAGDAAAAELGAQPALWVMWASALTMGGAQSSTIEEEATVAEATLGVTAGENRAQPGRRIVRMLAVAGGAAQRRRDDHRPGATGARCCADNLPMRTTTAWSLARQQMRRARQRLALCREAIDGAGALATSWWNWAPRPVWGRSGEAEGDLHEAEANIAAYGDGGRSAVPVA